MSAFNDGITPTQERRCSTCLHKVDGLGDYGHDQKPKANDIAICWYCGQLSVLDDKLNLRPMSQAEVRELQIEEPEAYEQLIKCAETIKLKINNN